VVHGPRRLDVCSTRLSLYGTGSVGQPATTEWGGGACESAAAFQAVYTGSIPVTRSSTPDLISIIATAPCDQPRVKGGQSKVVCRCSADPRICGQAAVPSGPSSMRLNAARKPSPTRADLEWTNRDKHGGMSELTVSVREIRGRVLGSPWIYR
jgi:hypothetical protein